MINNLLKATTLTLVGTRPSKTCDLTQPVLVNAYVPPSDEDLSYSEYPGFQSLQLCPEEQPNSLSNKCDGWTDNHVNSAQQPATAATSTFSSSITATNNSSSSSSIPITITPAADIQHYQGLHYTTFSTAVFSDSSSSSSYSQSFAINNTYTTANHISETSPILTTARGIKGTTPAATTTTAVRPVMPEQSLETEVVLAAEGESEGTHLHLEFDGHDDKIMAATVKAFETGSLTPLIKEELRCTIQSRRLAAGKGELQVEFKRPSKRKEMTDEERVRALKRRQQNREAAQRFRQRQKDTGDYLSAKIKRLEKASNGLIADLKKLREERDQLKKMLEDHLVVCQNPSHAHLTVEFDINQFLQELSVPTVSTSLIPDAISECPDTADSGESVFFSDEGSTVAQPPEELFLSHSSSLAESLSSAPEACYEEVVEGMDYVDSISEYSDDQRLDSCSSVDGASNYGSMSSETYSLSDSTTDLRHSLVSAYSRVHMNSCSSERFETVYLAEDFLLSNDDDTYP